MSFNSGCFHSSNASSIHSYILRDNLSQGGVMSGISQFVLYAVCRVETTFGNSAAPLASRTRQGTGFWLGLDSGRRAFVLNRHSVDPRLASGLPEGFSLEHVRVELRRYATVSDDQISAQSETRFFRVSDLRGCLSIHETADCAVLVAPTFDEPLGEFRPLSIKETDIADEPYLSGIAGVMDLASFIGYPSKPPLWDQGFTLPIARLCSLASMTGRAFVNEAIPTSDAGLVAGLSFGGSSGSPLWLHAKPGVAPRIIGLMSGHHSTLEDTELHHTGISWYTRSPAILQLLAGELRGASPQPRLPVQFTDNGPVG